MENAFLLLSQEKKPWQHLFPRTDQHMTMCDFYSDRLGENISNNCSEGNGLEEPRNSDTHQKINDLFHQLPDLQEKKNVSNKKNNYNDFSDTYLVSNYMKYDKSYHEVSNIIANSILKPGLEKEHSVPLLKDKVLKLNRKKLREKTKGDNWYNLPATEITEDIKNDLQVLQMRSVLNKNHFYKKNDVNHISKYFQIGTVVENAADFYSGRIVKSQRKKTIIDELLADAECKNYQKKKYKEIMDTSRRNPRSKIRKLNSDKPNKRHSKSKKKRV